MEIARDSLFATLHGSEYGTLNAYSTVTNLRRATYYYWRVRGTSLVGNSTWSNSTFRTSYAAPLPLTPAINATVDSTRPLFTWSVVDGADFYQLQVSPSVNFTTLTYNLTYNGVLTSALMAAEFTRNSSLFWRIRSLDTPFGPSDWSVTVPFTVPYPPTTPSILLPLNNVLVNATSPPVFNWTVVTSYAVAPFDHYEAQLSIDSGFSTPTVMTSNNIAITWVTIPASLMPATTYYLRVKAVNGLGHSSAWSATNSIRTLVSTPTNVAPTSGSSVLNLRPAFSWTAVNDGTVTGYQLQTSTALAFTLLGVNVTSVTNSYSPVANLASGSTIFWRVRALSGQYGPGVWSTPFTLITSVPPADLTLISPANNTVAPSLIPTLKWSNASLAAGVSFGYYQVQVASDAAFANLVADSQVTVLNIQNFTLASNPLTVMTTYYWRVRAFNGAGAFSNWSPVWSFRAPIASPTLTFPAAAAQAMTIRPTFNWTAVSNAVSYTIQVSAAATFTPLLVNVSSLTTFATVGVDLPKNVTLYWRVQANHATFGPSAFASSSFKSSVAPSIGAITLPANGSTVLPVNVFLKYGTATLTATTVFGNYQLQIAPTMDFSSPIVDVSIPTLAQLNYNVTALPGASLLFFRYRALTSDGQFSIWSNVITFRTTDVAPTLLAPADGSSPTSIAPDFSWSASTVPGLLGYSLQVSNASIFKTIFATINTTGTATTATPTALLPKVLSSS